MRVSVDFIISAFLLNSCITLGAASQITNEDRGTDSSDENLVHISIDNNDAINLRISRDGKLAYLNLPSLDTNNVTVSSDTDATCFLWHYNRLGNDMGDDFVSSSFTAYKPLLNAYPRAERIYCYDSTRDKEDNDVYAIFLENLAGQKDLVRIRLQDEAGTYGLLDLESAVSDAESVDPNLRVNVRKAALIAAPVLPPAPLSRSNTDSDQYAGSAAQDSSEDHPLGHLSAVPRLNYCYALWAPGAKRFFTATNAAAFFPYKTLARIYCYKAHMGFEDSIPFDKLDNW